MSKLKGLSDKLYDIVWTGIRHMVSTSSTSNIERNINAIKAIAPKMNISQRQKTAYDIRRNVEWNELVDTELGREWMRLVELLEKDDDGEVKKTRSKRKVDDNWFELIKHSLPYFHSSHTYSTDTSNAIAQLYPMMNDKQRQWLHDWFKDRDNSKSDENVQKLGALCDLNNRYAVMVNIFDYKLDELCDKYKIGRRLPFIDCFKFKDYYYPLVLYYERGVYSGYVNPPYILDIIKTTNDKQQQIIDYQ